MGGNDGESRRFHLFGMRIGMKTASLEPGLELALRLCIPCGAHGGMASGRKDMRDVAAPGPARKRKAGREYGDVVFGAGPVIAARARP